MEEKTLGKRIVTLRKAKGLTQDQLADKVGVSPQAVSKWENDFSCPDISVLPLLAEIFEVSVDELLGVKPMQEPPAETEPPKQETQNEGRNKSGFTFHYDTGKKDGIWFGLFVAVVGIILIVNYAFGLDAGFWSIIWPCAILALGVGWMASKFSYFALGAAVFGIYFLLQNLGLIDWDLPWGIIVAVALVFCGISIVNDAFRPKRVKQYHSSGKATKTCTSQDGYFKCDYSFCEETVYIAEELLRGGSADLSFGKITLDLSGCVNAAQDAVIHIDNSFGQTELLVPRRFAVICEEDCSFGSVTTQGHCDSAPVARLHIDCDTSFGNIVIRYI